MTQEKLLLRIVASLYPDRKPSEIRKIIDKALEKPECADDIELWNVMTKERSEPEKERIIEHHYHETPHWYPVWYESKPYNLCDWKITCGDTFTGTDSNAVSSLTIDARNCVLEELGVY